MTPELGTIEGYFGRPWSWAARTRTMRILAAHDYSFFLYAPKADAKLRRDWRLPFDDGEIAQLSQFAQACRDAGVAFGIGLSPFEAYLDFSTEARDALKAKLTAFDTIGADWLAILFDDMRGDVPDLAQSQVEIAHFAAEHSEAKRLIVCPTYYSNDPVLDRAFGARPPNYLQQLGEMLDPAIDIFWTGEEVCSREYGVGHLRDVAGLLKRKPMLWDNYPVNDGPRMSPHLHLRAFTGRPAVLGDAISAHGVNPALQPTLSCIPMITLAMSYRQGDAYCYGSAFFEAASAVAGPELAAMLQADMLALQDAGLDRIGERKARLRERYSCHDNPAAREVVGWLDGADLMTAEEVQTQ